MRIQKPTITQISSLKGDGAELTGSFKGTFEDNIISGAAQIAGLDAGIISSSAQIDTDLFDIDGLVSGSIQIAADISGSLSATHVNTKVPGLLSSSAQIAANISGAFDAASASLASGPYIFTSTSFGGDVSGTYNALFVTDDSHNHIISNVDGLQDALNLKAPLASPTFTGTVAGVTKAHVGLENVDNTSDANKPVSTATQTALDLKAPLASPALTGAPTAPTQTGTDDSTKIATTAFVQGRVDAIIGTAGAALDTLGELSASLANDQDALASLTTTVSGKLAKASNLSDLSDASAARTNLGVDTKANTWTGVSGDVTITSVGVATVADDSHNHIIGNVDGLQAALDAKQASGTYNTIIGTDTDISYAGATVLSAMNMTDGVIESHSSRTLTLADLGYTGATNANYITNNNQLTNGAGFTTYSANQTLDNTSNVHFEGLMVGQTSGATANTIRCVGDVVAYYSSDKQFKDNIVTLEGALDKVKAIRGVRFDWNDKQDVYEGHDIGVVAQEVEAVLPELVHYREHSDSKAVDYVKLTAVLIEAVKELSAKVDELSK